MNGKALMTNEMHNSHNQFYSTVFCLLYMFRTNLVVHHQETGIIYCTTQYNRYNRAYSTFVPNCVIQYIMPCSWWWTTKFFRNMHSRQKKLWNKIDCENCASRWSLTRCNMMHGTHNVKWMERANPLLLVVGMSRMYTLNLSPLPTKQIALLLNAPQSLR